MLGMSYSRGKNFAAQGMYWRVWSKCQRPCWLCFQVLAVMYFLPWFQVIFWEGAQTMRKSTKHAHLHDIHEVWLNRYGSTTHGPPLVCFYFHWVLEKMLGRSWKDPRENLSISSMLSAHCSSALASNSLYKNKERSQWRSMIGSDIELLFFCRAEEQSANNFEEIDCV